MWHLECRVAPPTLHSVVQFTYSVPSTAMFTKPVTALLGLLALCLTMALASKSAEQLQIGVKYKPDECPLKTRNGDRLSMQYVTILSRPPCTDHTLTISYTGTLAKDGSKFDSSLDRNQPFEFTS